MSVAVAARGDLNREQWRRLVLVLPARSRLGRPPIWTYRQLIDGIRWRIRVGAPWRDVPPVYGSWQRVYGLFRGRRGSTGGRPPVFDREDYKARHAVECGINRLKQNRAVATRYDKLAVRYQATRHIAVINTWLRDF